MGGFDSDRGNQLFYIIFLRNPRPPAPPVVIFYYITPRGNKLFYNLFLRNPRPPASSPPLESSVLFLLVIPPCIILFFCPRASRLRNLSNSRKRVFRGTERPPDAQRPFPLVSEHSQTHLQCRPPPAALSSSLICRASARLPRSEATPGRAASSAPPSDLISSLFSSCRRAVRHNWAHLVCARA